MKIPNYSYKFTLEAEIGFRESLMKRLQLQGAYITSNSPEHISFSIRGKLILGKAPLLYRWFSFGNFKVTLKHLEKNEWFIQVDPVARRLATILFFCLIGLGLIMNYAQTGNEQQLLTGSGILLLLLALSASIPPAGEYLGIKKYFADLRE